MIFGLPAILGFIPLIVYIVLSVKGKDMTMTVLIAVVIGAIMTGQSLTSFGTIIQASLGSFLALIGFIIMLGSGLGEVLTQTKVAHNVVRLILTKMKIKSANQGILVTMITSSLLVAMLGTLAGANAILAPIVIPVLASMMVTRSTLGVILHGAGAIGLMVGPFVPPVVTVLGLTQITYGEYLIQCGIPLAIIVFITTYIVAKKVQKDTLGKTDYSEEDRSSSEELVMTPQIKRGTSAFIIGMVLMLGYGIFAKAGASYAVVVMLVVSFAVGLCSGMKSEEVLQAMVKGCARMFWMFLMFVLFDPLMNFTTQSGAFDALAGYLQPILDAGGAIVFMMISTLIGIFGISGAAVAQAKVIHELFGPMVNSLAIPMGIWAMVIMVGCQITSFAYPTGDMIGQMGLARSTDVKSMMKNGIALTVITVGFVFVRAVIFTFLGV